MSQSGPPGSSPPPSYVQGGVSAGGGGAQAGGPHTPRGGRSAIVFDPVHDWSTGDVDSILTQENYSVTHVTGDYGFDDPGNATLASFKSLANAGLAIVEAKPANLAIPVEYYCDPMKAYSVIENQYGADLDAGYLLISAEPGSPNCPNQLNHDEDKWAQKITAGDPNHLVVDFPKGVDPGPVVWAIAVTKKGIANYFANGRLSLLYLMDCGSAPLVDGLSSVDAVFSYGPSCGEAGLDLRGLFEDLGGSSGIEFRSTRTAYDNRASDPRIAWGADVEYQQFGGPVLLSPAVVNVDPPEAGFAEPGKSTPVTVTFDTEMSESEPVEVDGCGASVDGQQTWNGDSTQLTFQIKIPRQPPDNDLTVRIKSDSATASGSSGWPNPLSGNQNPPTLFSGLYPNRNDYVWHVACERALDLQLDGQISGKAVSGQVIGYPAPVLTCTPMTVGDQQVGNIVHWNGEASDTYTLIGGEFDVPFGTWDVGPSGKEAITIDAIQPFEHLGSISGTITQNPSGGSVDATTALGADTIHVKGTWNCPSSSSSSP